MEHSYSVGIFLLVTYWAISSVITQDEITELPPYQCPTDCQCSTMPEKPTFAVHMVCAQPGLTNLSSYEYIPSEFTVSLVFYCPYALGCGDINRKNWLVNDGFSHLTELENLMFSGFNFTEPIPNHAFRKLNHLQNLTIEVTNSKAHYCIPLEFESAAVLQHTPNVEYLGFYLDTILQLPDGMLCSNMLPHLKELNMSSNCLQNISDLGLNNCNSSLEVLDLTANLLKHIPQNLSAITPNLQKLILGFNMGIQLDKYSFADLPLILLNLEYIKMYEIQENMLSSLSSLETLILTGNFISAISWREFKNLTNLKTLRLDNNEIQNIDPDAFQTLLHLENLDLANNQLKRLSARFLNNLTYLQELDLSNNMLEYISSDIFKDNPNMRVLNLRSNNFRLIEERTFLNQGLLQVLDLGMNLITNIRNETLRGLRSLNTLHLDHNKITNVADDSFTDMSTTLMALNLTFNYLKEVPKSLQQLKALQVLDLMRNIIRELPVERSLYSLRNVLAIRISHNRINRVSRMFFGPKPILSLLNLEYNRLTQIQPGTLYDMPSLTHVVLTHNNFRTVSRLFYGITNLWYLDMSYNSLTRIDVSYLPDKIGYLDISFNNIATIEHETFKKVHNLMTVNLQFNNITTLDKLSLIVTNKNLPIVPDFYLAGNPFDCSCHLVWLKTMNRLKWETSVGIPHYPAYPNIRDFNRLTCKTLRTFNDTTYFTFMQNVEPSEFLCTFDTICIDSSLPCCLSRFYNSCSADRICPEGCNCFKTFDHNLKYINCDNQNWTALPDKLDFSTNMSLADNNLKILTAETFQVFGINYPIYLYLQNNVIDTIYAGTFLKFGNLKILRLDGNRLFYLDRQMFIGLKNLHTLHLENNLISAVGNETFRGLIELKILYLHGNYLHSVIDPYILMPPNHNLQELTLAGNNWTCQCDFAQIFKAWIVENVEVISDIGKITCSLEESSTVLDQLVNMTANKNSTSLNLTEAIVPENGTFFNYSTYKQNFTDSTNFVVQLASFNIERYCYLLNNLTQIVYGPPKIQSTGFSLGQRNIFISIIVVFLMVAVVTTLIYTFRDTIKVWLFTRYGWRPFYNHKEDFTNLYDAYVSYSDKQLNFVVHELLPKLEQEKPKYKLFLRSRDLIPGGVRAEDTINAIENSRRSIIILTDNYAEDEWCKFEFQRAHYNALHTTTHRIIVVTLYELASDHIDKEMQLYLRTGSYLKASDKSFWGKLRYALPDTRKRNKDANLVQIQRCDARAGILHNEEEEQNEQANDGNLDIEQNIRQNLPNNLSIQSLNKLQEYPIINLNAKAPLVKIENIQKDDEKVIKPTKASVPVEAEDQNNTSDVQENPGVFEMEENMCACQIEDDQGNHQMEKLGIIQQRSTSNDEGYSSLNSSPNDETQEAELWI